MNDERGSEKLFSSSFIVSDMVILTRDNISNNRASRTLALKAGSDTVLKFKNRYSAKSSTAKGKEIMNYEL
ncbi:MAG: hypothetical protein M3362_04160 [Acidobacteriota bacterium]|nr:hypothetical protein [Acidobacteriota bacterium]